MIHLNEVLTDSFMRAAISLDPVCTPDDLLRIACTVFDASPETGIIVGPAESRIAILPLSEDDRAIFASPRGPLRENQLFRKFSDILLEEPHNSVSEAIVPPGFINRMSRPRVHLLALCHKETFPLPRFALGISQIAHTLRRKYLGQVTLDDMQLHGSIPLLVQNILTARPDILGISVTFGQYDLLCDLLVQINSILQTPPTIVVGGSLPTLISDEIIDRHPNVVVCRGFGESAMVGIVEAWLGERPVGQINGITARLTTANLLNPDCQSVTIGSIGREPALHVIQNESQQIQPMSFLRSSSLQQHDSPSVLTTSRLHSEDDYHLLPDLDLLSQTLRRGGVTQLEFSRGCTFACSFCPREQKGLWASGDVTGAEEILSIIAQVHDQFPMVARKIFCVDEELIGYADDSVGRILALGALLSRHRFHFEAVTRVDQVYKPARDLTWHIGRIDMWRALLNFGLDRVLFGIESGVTSVLKRFNKGATGEQNTTAIRLLSAIGVPFRLTYITFDPLMSWDELIESYKFQGRTDLLFRSRNDLSSAELYSLANQATPTEIDLNSIPLYHEIPYLLVSMEALMGSEYLRKLEIAGLAGERQFQMGRRSASYRENDIGLLSVYCQFWIDRNFALDYTIKSLMKRAERGTRSELNEIRTVLKDCSYSILGQFLTMCTGDLELQSPFQQPLFDALEMKLLIDSWQNAKDVTETKKRLLLSILDRAILSLKTLLIAATSSRMSRLNEEQRQILTSEIDRWADCDEWRIINDN